MNTQELTTLIKLRLDIALGCFNTQAIVTSDKETLMREFRCFQSQLVFARDLIGSYDGQTIYDQYRRDAFLILKGRMDALK